MPETLPQIQPWGPNDSHQEHKTHIHRTYTWITDYGKQ